MCLNAVAAEYFQLVCDDFAHRNGGSALLGQQKPDLDVLAALAQIADGIETGGGMSKCVQGNVSASLRDFDDCFCDIGDASSVHDGDRAQSAREPERFFGNIN